MKPDRTKEFESLIDDLVARVIASRRRRLMMREELLSHVWQAYEQELSVGPDEATAYEAALRRFGVLGELRREIQASVPTLERWFFTVFGAKENLMLASHKVIGGVLALIGLTFMFGMALVLPATARIAGAVSPDKQTGGVLESAEILKASLISMTLFALLVMVCGLGMLGYAFFFRRGANAGGTIG